MTPPWLASILAAIRPLIPREFVGSFRINVFKGGISTVNLEQTFKEGEKPDDGA